MDWSRIYGIPPPVCIEFRKSVRLEEACNTTTNKKKKKKNYSLLDYLMALFQL